MKENKVLDDIEEVSVDVLPGRCPSASVPRDSQILLRKLDKVLFLPYYHRLCKVILENVQSSQKRYELNYLEHRQYLLPIYRKLLSMQKLFSHHPCCTQYRASFTIIVFSLSWTLTGKV